jgi:hypothetical protein
MIAKNVQKQELINALIEVNKLFDDNITFFGELEPKNKLNTRWSFRLKVKDSKGKGARRGFSGRRMISACWHVHGEFFDAIFKENPNAEIVSRGKSITKDYGNWIDSNVGSLMDTLYFSEACDCQ